MTRRIAIGGGKYLVGHGILANQDNSVLFYDMKTGHGWRLGFDIVDSTPLPHLTPGVLFRLMINENPTQENFIVKASDVQHA